MRDAGQATSATDLQSWSDEKLITEIKKQIRIDVGGQNSQSAYSRRAQEEGIPMAYEKTVAQLQERAARETSNGSRSRVQSKLDELERRLRDFRVQQMLPQKARTELWRIGTAAIVIRDGCVLLGRRIDTGEWEFPGGKVDWEDGSMLDAVIRELAEETGLDCTGFPDATSYLDQGWVEFVGYGENDGHFHDSQWLCLFHRFYNVAGEPKLMEPDKHHGWEFFPLNKIPSPARELVECGLTKCVGHGGWKYGD